MDSPPLDSQPAAVGTADETANESEEATPLPAGRRAARSALAAAATYLIFYRVCTFIRNSSELVVVITTLLSLPILLYFTVEVARALRTGRELAMNCLAAAALSLPIILPRILFALAPHWGGWPAVIRYLSAYHSVRDFVPGIDGLLLIWLAATIGVAVARLLREMKMLLPIAVVLACVDMWVVFGGGLVTQAQSGKSRVAQSAMTALTVKLPTTHTTRGAAPMQLAVGFADFLFVALFFSAFARFGIPSRRTFGVLCIVLALYMFVVAETTLALPALVPIAVVVVGINLRRFRYERSEAFALLYAGLIIAAAAAVLVLRRR